MAEGGESVPPGLSATHAALIYNARSEVSKELAEYYAGIRSVAPDQMLAIDVPVGETLPRKTYERRVVKVVRDALRGRWKDRPIRCFVTFYDVPIRVGKRPPTAEEKELASKADRAYAASDRELEALIDQMERLASRSAPPVRPSQPAGKPVKLKVRTKQYEAARASASERIHRLGPEERMAAQQAMVRLIQTADGTAEVVSRTRLGPGAGDQDRERLEALQAGVEQGLAEIHRLLALGPTSPQRPEAWEKIKKLRGLRGQMEVLDEDRRRLLGDGTPASFDSELSLVAWDAYPLYRSMVNLLNVRHGRNPQLRKSIPSELWDAPVYMVSRLDGPSPEIVRRMIDDAMAVERKGLTGHVYIDARGYRKKDAYLAYDKNLIQLGQLVRGRTKLPTVVDTREALFSAGQCPDTALYCGWYSHKKYVDAFNFVPGAVAVHLASSEAMSLRDPTKRYWCKSLLADGAAATLGPVNEPYLSSFPLPSEFFGLLLTGQYSLVECYYYTKQCNSWMLLLLGDPFYRPFAMNPQLKVSDVFDSSLLPLPDLTHPVSEWE